MNYYLSDLKKLIDFLVPKGARTIILSKPTDKDKLKGKYDYIVLRNLVGDVDDVQFFIESLKKYCRHNTRLVVIYYNHLWEPVLKLASFLGWRKVKHNQQQNWLDGSDLKGILSLSGFETISSQRRFLFPLDWGGFSDLINRYVAGLPVINSLCLTTCVIARIKDQPNREYSVSIIIPARNEMGNIYRALKTIPRFGKSMEIIFVEGHSSDKTWEIISKAVKKYNSKRRISVKAFQQKGKGKADAVRLGFEKARGQILMILDADLTVDPSELIKFYKVLSSGQGEFANGCRLIYPMEKEAMRTLNKIGNKIFGLLFSFILGQRFKDVLCGTKVLFRKDYKNITKNRKYFGDFDPFGDFDLIFGAVKQNLKIVEVPVRYKDRTYGSSNINRFRHGWLLLKMTWFAFGKFKAY